MTEREQLLFRWCYRAVLALALRTTKDPDAFHGGREEWSGMVGTSHSMYLHTAREEAGIPNDEFLEVVRSGEVDVDDIYDMGSGGVPLPLEQGGKRGKE